MRKAKTVSGGLRDDPLRDPFVSDAGGEAEAIPLLDDLMSPSPNVREEVSRRKALRGALGPHSWQTRQV